MRLSTIGRLTAVSLLLVSGAALAAPEVTATHGTVKVFPTQAPPAHQPVELMAARNEFVSFQVVVHADATGAANVSASLPTLTGPAGTIPATHVTLYRQGYLDITQPSFTTAAKGRYPDPLIPDVDETVGEKRNAFPFSVPANENRVIWVDVLIPKSAAPGLYTGSVQVTGAGFQSSVPVSINVLNTELPSTASLATAFLFARNGACATHTGNSECVDEAGSYVLRNKYMKMGLEHRITLSNTLSYPYSGDWELFDQRYAPWLNGTLQTRLPGAKMTSAQFPGRREAKLFTDFTAHMKAKGWLDRAYDYTGDEPPYGISFSEALSRLKMVKQAAPELRTLLTTTIQESEKHGISPYLDLIVPVVNHLDGATAPYVGDQRTAYDGFLKESGNNLWLYQSCMSHGCAFGTNAPENTGGAGWPSYMVDASAARNRAMQWVAFLSNVHGELYYETALALNTAWDSVHRFNGNGDGTLFYPGLPARIGGKTDVPLPSLRLKQIRQGMQDYEWLKKVADAGDPAFARQIARTLIPAAHKVGDDGAAFEAARKHLVSRWLELNPPPAVEPQPMPVAAAPPVLGTDRLGAGPGSGTPPASDDPGFMPDDLSPTQGGNGRVSGRLGCSGAGSALSLLGLVAVGLLGLRRRARF